MNDLYIMKVGGSVCTEKQKNRFKARFDVIKRIASEIKKARQTSRFSLILVHGAGPFGHTNVKKFGINNGIHTEEHVKGFIKTHMAMADLNSHFLRAFEMAGIPAVTIDPTACIVQENKRIISFDTRQIELLFAMNQNIVPIMHGDMVLDTRLKGSVVSGDAIVGFLAKKLGAKKVFSGTDVDGLFTADPKLDKKARLVPKVNGSNYWEVIKMAKEASTVDVTGGMRGKLEKIRQGLSGVEVLIFNMGKKRNTEKALKGEEIKGTKIRF